MPNEEEIKKEEPQKENKKDKKKSVKLDYEEELAKAKAEIEHWKNEYYRAYADTKNLRANLEKDHKEAIKYRAEGFVEELFPILDSFHTVLANEPESQELKNYLIGFQYIYKNLLNVLANEGVSEIAPKVGDNFDPKTMNGVDTVVADKADKVMKIYTNGYKLHDRIIRPASVQVSVLKKEEPEKEEKKSDA